MAFKGRDPVTSKILIKNKIIEKVNSFNYLGNLLSYERKVDIDSKLNNYLKITVCLGHRKGIKLHSTLAFPAVKPQWKLDH